MNLTINILLDQLRKYKLKAYVNGMEERSFSRPALLPRDYEIMRPDLIHVCRLSDALRASAQMTDMAYICVRDRILDDQETEERLKGMIVINENVEVENLLSIVSDIFLTIGEWQRQMQDALIHDRGLQQLLDLSVPILENTINISDSAFMLLARTDSIETDDPLSVELKKFGYHPETTLQKFREQHRFADWDQVKDFIINDSLAFSPYVLVNKVFRFRNTYFIHVVMTCDHHPLSDGLLELFGLLTDILAIYAERNWKDKNALSHNYDSFMMDLITGTLTSPADIEDRAKYLGVRTGDRMVLMKLTVAPGSEAALGRIGRELSELLPSVQVILYDRALLALIHLRPAGNSLGVSDEELQAFLTQHQASAAVSNIFTGLENIPAAFRQASLALKYDISLRGREIIDSLLPVTTDVKPIPFQKRVLHSLLGESPRGEEIWHYSRYYQVLRDLYLSDQQHGTNNLQLLRVYLYTERKATDTGQLLHMHRNNVIYHMGRIESSMGLDLNDQGTRLGLEMSFILLDIYGFLEETTRAE